MRDHRDQRILDLIRENTGLKSTASRLQGALVEAEKQLGVYKGYREEQSKSLREDFDIQVDLRKDIEHWPTHATSNSSPTWADAKISRILWS